MNIHAYMKLTSTFRYIHSLAISNQLLTLKLKKQLLLYWSNEGLSVPVRC